MNPQESSKGQSLSFIQRFQGKKSAITKEGLLHLFDAHRQKANLPSQSQSTEGNSPTQQLVLKPHLQSRARDIIRSGRDIEESRKEGPGSKMSYRTEALRNDKTGEASKQFALPKLMNRFNSSHQQLLSSRQNEVSEVQERNASRTNKVAVGGSESLAIRMRFHQKLDANALQHLQFLSRLQEKWACLKNHK